MPPELLGFLSRKFEQGLDHVVRRRILRALHGRKSGEASPVDLFRHELADDSLSGVAYHCRVLLTCNLVELVRTEEARGSVRHIYGSVVKDDSTVLAILLKTTALDVPRRGTNDDGAG